MNAKTKAALLSVVAAVGMVSGAIASTAFVNTGNSNELDLQLAENYGERYISSPADWKVHSAESGGTIPKISFDFPDQVRVGVPFEINIPYSYVGFDPEDGEVDWTIPSYFNSSFWDANNDGTRVIVGWEPELELLNDPGFNSTSTHYSAQWNRNFTDTYKIIPYDITQEHDIKLVFNMTEPIKYPNEHFSLGIDFVTMNYYFNEYDGHYKISLDRDPPQFAPGAEPKPPYSGRGSSEGGGQPSPDFDPKRPANMESFRDIMNTQGETILEYHPQYETIEDFIRDNFAIDWVDDFLTKYPEFKKQSVNLDSVFSFLLPSAYGQQQFVNVIGKVLIQDDSSSSFLDPSTQITACLVDENTAFANGSYTIQVV